MYVGLVVEFMVVVLVLVCRLSPATTSGMAKCFFFCQYVWRHDRFLFVSFFCRVQNTVANDVIELHKELSQLYYSINRVNIKCDRFIDMINDDAAIYMKSNRIAVQELCA